MFLKKKKFFGRVQYPLGYRHDLFDLEPFFDCNNLSSLFNLNIITQY